MSHLNYYSLDNINNFESRFRGNFVNSLSGFKSANLVGTKDSKAHTNLAIVSSATHVGADPALISILFRPDVSERHTLENIRQSKICTLNHINAQIIESSHQTSARYPKETSEFDACNLTTEYLENFDAPFVKESQIKMALKLEEEIFLKINGTNFLIFSIQGVHLNKEIIHSDGYIDIEKAKTICVSGLDSYHETKSRGRLSYAKPNQPPRWI